MKKKFLILFMVIKMSIFISSAQWVLHHSFTYDTSYNNPDQGLEDVAFCGKDTGIYAYVTNYNFNYTTTIELTTNNSKDWKQIYKSTISPHAGPGGIVTLRLIYSYPNTFFVVNRSDYGYSLEKMNTDGSDYHLINYNLFDSFGDISIPDTNNIFLLSYNSNNIFSIRKCIGNNWVVIDSLVPYGSNELYFTDSLNGFLTVQNPTLPFGCHTILKSTTGGSSWVQSFNDGSINITKLFFLSAQKGFAVGENGKVMKTIDGGATWQFINTNQPKKLNDILFFNDTLGYVVGDENLIMQTTNGGLTWQYNVVSPSANGNFLKLIPISSSQLSAYAVLFNSNYGTAFDAWLYSIGIEESTQSLADFQIYPNPTTNTVTVYFPKNNMKAYTFNLYDVTGQKIQITSQTNYEQVTLYLQSLDKGIYFLELMMDGEKVVKKIVKM